MSNETLLSDDKDYNDAMAVLITCDGQGKAAKLAAFAKACTAYRRHTYSAELQSLRERADRMENAITDALHMLVDADTPNSLKNLNAIKRLDAAATGADGK